MSNLSHVDAVRRSLQNPPRTFPPRISEIIDGLVADGFARDGDEVLHAKSAAAQQTFREMRKAAVLTAVQAAADPQKRVLVDSVKAQAKSLGFLIEDNKPIDMFALDQSIKGKPLEDRFRLKEALYFFANDPRLRRTDQHPPRLIIDADGAGVDDPPGRHRAALRRAATRLVRLWDGGECKPCYLDWTLGGNG